MILCIIWIITVPFPGTRNPPQNPFLCIFKHNQIFTYPSTASSDKVSMGCGFPVPRNPESYTCSSSWEHPSIYQDLVFEKRAHTVLQTKKTRM
jgi:hypothetical protein